MKNIKNEKGFTLIELLVVVAIIGILVAIAIPQFASYRTQANNGAAKTQLRNAAVAMESYFVGANTYTSTIGDLTSFGYKHTSNVTVTIAGTASNWTATATHSAGDATYTWNASAGGLQ